MPTTWARLEPSIVVAMFLLFLAALVYDDV
jgi:hypothetical protein